jgi:hypothetical protein
MPKFETALRLVADSEYEDENYLSHKVRLSHQSQHCS